MNSLNRDGEEALSRGLANFELQNNKGLRTYLDEFIRTLLEKVRQETNDKARLDGKIELCDILISQGHGGGNWRRIINEHRGKYLEAISALSDNKK